MLINAIWGDITPFQAIISFASCIVIIFISLPIHEWAHGFLSTCLGDPTPRYQGRLTLNPLSHIDWLGAAGILLFGIGWAKPVQVNARYYKSPKWGMALVALAGPLSNLLTAFVAYFLYYLILSILSLTGLLQDGSIWLDIIDMFFYVIAYISIRLAVFNFLPVPPFDGSRILFVFLPQKYYFKIMQYERFIFIGILIVLYTGILNTPITIISEVVLWIVQYVTYLPFNLLLGVLT